MTNESAAEGLTGVTHHHNLGPASTGIVGEGPVASEPEAPKIDPHAPMMARGNNAAINLLIDLGAFNLPWFHPLRGITAKDCSTKYIAHNGKREMERRKKQLSRGHIKQGDYKYGKTFVTNPSLGSDGPVGQDAHS